MRSTAPARGAQGRRAFACRAYHVRSLPSRTACTSANHQYNKRNALGCLRHQSVRRRPPSSAVDRRAPTPLPLPLWRLPLPRCLDSPSAAPRPGTLPIPCVWLIDGLPLTESRAEPASDAPERTPRSRGSWLCGVREAFRVVGARPGQARPAPWPGRTWSRLKLGVRGQPQIFSSILPRDTRPERGCCSYGGRRRSSPQPPIRRGGGGGGGGGGGVGVGGGES